MKLTTKQMSEIVYGFWAEKFGAPKSFDETFTHVIDEELENRVVLYEINNASVIRIGGIRGELGLKSDETTDAAQLTQRIENAGSRVGEHSLLIDFFLDTKDFMPKEAKKGFAARQVFADRDAQSLRSLFDSCSEKDLDAADIYTNNLDPVNFGIFKGDTLCAYASFRFWGDSIGDIGVLVHPGFRSMGLASSVVSALCEYCADNAVVPMYRVFNTHAHSLRIPIGLGFMPLVKVHVLKLQG